MVSSLPRKSYILYRLMWRIIDWIYPPNCGGCGRVGSRWCTTCGHLVNIISEPVCMQCGHDFFNGEICEYCKDDPPNFKSLKSWAIYEGPLRKAILRLKYSGDISLAETLSVPMIELLNGTDWKLDAVAPVPISEKRSEDRGYNQAALLAFPISLKKGIPYRKNALKKVRENRSQVGLTFDERYKNVIDAFICGDDFIIDKAVLVVDDVVTSGATMNECAKVLMDKGAREVYGITLARAGIQ